jgi:hypothetical protein
MLHKYLPIVPDKNRRLTFQLVSILSWMICAGGFMNFILPSLNLTQAQVVVTVLWVLMPVAAISAIAYGLGDAFRRLA